MESLIFKDIEDLTRQALIAIGVKIYHYGDLKPEKKALCLEVSEYGFYMPGTQKLFLNDAQSKEEQIKTLLHELGHVIMRSYTGKAAEEKADRFMDDFYYILTKLQEYQQEHRISQEAAELLGAKRESTRIAEIEKGE